MLFRLMNTPRAAYLGGAMAVAALLPLTPPAHGQGLAANAVTVPISVTATNLDPDPYQDYGKCAGNINTKFGQVVSTGKSPGAILSIEVITCPGATAGPPATLVQCPVQKLYRSPYSYCVSNGNDGAGNSYLMGVIEANTDSDPNATVLGCLNTPPVKLALFQTAGGDPRLIKGMVTLFCGPATSASYGAPAFVPCPGFRGAPKGTFRPFFVCIFTPNDGNGNAVMVGVLRTDGAGDPHGLYGACRTTGGSANFRQKSAIVTDAGGSLDSVRTIDLWNCFDPTTNPSIPSTPPAVVDCVSVIAFPGPWFTNSTCYAGQDVNGNYLVAVVR